MSKFLSLVGVLGFSGLSKWGDAESVMKDWAADITKVIKQAHGMPAQ